MLLVLPDMLLLISLIEQILKVELAECLKL